MAICFSLTNLDLGGAQVFVVRLANHLAEKHKQPVYIYDHWPEFRQANTLHNLHPLVRILSYSENRFERWVIWKLNALLRKINSRFEFRYHLNKKRLEKALVRNKITVVNSHMSYSDFVLANAILPGDCILVITLHGEYELLLKESAGSSEKPQKIKQALNKASALIYTADKNMEAINKLADLTSIRKEKINIGFDPALFSAKKISREEFGLSQNDFVVGMISRGFAEKGWDTAIAAIQLHNKSAPQPVKLLCIGNGTYLKELVAGARDSNISLVQFDKNYQDYFYCYPLFDLFIFPTRFEGESVPNVLIECLYWKIPVIASKHAEIPAMLRSETASAAGMCIDTSSGNIKQDFADALALLKNDTELRDRFRSNSQAAFEAFSMEKVAEAYRNVFTSLR